MIENLFNPAIKCTDPDNLQFCLPLSDTEFWYCEPNGYNDLMNTEGTEENQICEKYKGNPTGLIESAKMDEAVKKFLSNKQHWLTGAINVNDFPHTEKVQLLEDYGYSWDSFTEDKDRNQIICENYFEQNPMDFRNDT